MALQPFDGRDVLSTTVAIRNAGDGLSAAMKVDPVEMHHDEKVYVVLECVVAKVSFDPIKDTDGLQRVHVLKAGAATIVDESVVQAQLDEQRRKLEEAAGVQRLEFPSDATKDPEGDPLGVFAGTDDDGPEQIPADDDPEAWEG